MQYHTIFFFVDEKCNAETADTGNDGLSKMVQSLPEPVVRADNFLEIHREGEFHIEAGLGACASTRLTYNSPASLTCLNFLWLSDSDIATTAMSSAPDDPSAASKPSAPDGPSATFEVAVRTRPRIS